jgi:5-formyltetrahydrofolate cyclo-ligase
MALRQTSTRELRNSGGIKKIFRKKEIRELVTEKRKYLDESFVENASNKIVNRFIKMDINYESCLLYYSINSEVRTYNLIEKLISQCKRVYLPIYKKQIKGIGLCPNTDKLERGVYGIKQPLECTDIKSLDIAIVPGLAFDYEGHRIGYGAGFYDYILRKFEVKSKIGFAFEFQIFQILPNTYFDVLMDVVITEKNIYRRKL